MIGLPGGIQSPLFEVLQAANVNGMRLLPGDGNTFSADGRPAEDDVINTVWVLDSDKLAFNRAEQYHQFHNGIGERGKEWYRYWVWWLWWWLWVMAWVFICWAWGWTGSVCVCE